MTKLSDRIEDELERHAGVSAAVEERDGSVVLSGIIETEEQRQAAMDIVAAIAPGMPVIDNLDVESFLPEEIDGLDLSEADTGNAIGATAGLSDDESIEAGDFTEQRTLNDPYGASGPGGTTSDEDYSEGEEVYVPPIDPVMDGDRVIGGFAASSMDYVGATPSSEDGRPGDEALADAIRRELREDSATSGLRIHVHVERGVARLRGTVQDVIDAENAEEVASRVPGVVEVLEELDVSSGAF